MYKLFVLTLVIILLNSESECKKVLVSKCCLHGESLGMFNKEHVCLPGATEPWAPKVYSRKKQEYLTSIPANWEVLENHKPDCGTFNATLLKNSYLILESGYMFDSNTKISPDKYCVENHEALVCLETVAQIQELQRKQVVVRECCGPGGLYNKQLSQCVITNATDNLNLNEGSNKENITFVTYGSLPSCDNNTAIVVGSFDDFKLNKDGSVTSITDSITIPSTHYCIEIFQDGNELMRKILACQEYFPAQMFESESSLRLTLYPIGLLISVVFLIATLATGFLLPSSHHMLHWRCQTNHVTCLLIGDILLATAQLAGHKITGPACLGIAIAMHFFFLATFFWLNTMCFNIWWTFRDLRPASLEKSQESCRLRLYEVYAWGGPFVIAGLAALLESLPDDDYSGFLKPRFGENSCWFNGDMEILAYFYGPIGALLVVNLVLFAVTARELTCGLWKREVVKSTTERAALGRVCLKLVVVMGVSWIADVISWAAGGPHALWYLTDIINTLQGLFIFIVIGCQPQIWSAFKRLWCLRTTHKTETTGHGNHHSSSSQGLPSLGDSVTNHTFTNNSHISQCKLPPLETSC